MNFAEIAPALADAAKAVALIEGIIWPNGPVCPHCEATDRIYAIKANPTKRVRHGLRKCGHCRKQFTVKVGTIFEDSNLPMSKWLMTIWMMCSSKKGVSANQLSRQLEISYKAAWFVCHRVREAMAVEPLRSMLGAGGSIVELDETYVGGKLKNNKHRNKTAAAGKKHIVMTLIDREGDVRSVKIPNTRKGTLHAVARPIVSGSAHIITDENTSHEGIDKHFASHHTINHSETFVRGLIFHTNFAESYHSLLKRSIVGTHHHLSEKHLPRYLREREFMWNNRKATDGERTETAIGQAVGKRLKYRQPA